MPGHGVFVCSGKGAKIRLFSNVGSVIQPPQLSSRSCMTEPQTDSNPFPHTQWTLVIDANDKNSAIRERALEELCRRYWLPIYAYGRRLGYSPADAEDLTQGFFKMMLRRHDLGKADRDRGKFRTFVRTAFRNFTKDFHKYQNAQKRGGDAVFISIDQEIGENRLREFGSSELTPEQEFDRQFAIALLERSLKRLRDDYARKEKAERFELLRPYLDDASAPPYAELALRLNQSEGAVKSTIHRFRGQFRKVTIQEITDTLGRDGDPEDELRYLRGLFS